MKIKLTSGIVDEQEKALRFYTAVLGFIKKNDVPAALDGKQLSPPKDRTI